MGWIRDLFTAVLNMSVTGGITILAILALRILLKKAPRTYLYALWLAAAFRLLCPWAPYSGISLFNLEIFRSADMKGQTLTWYVPEGNGQAAETAIRCSKGFGTQGRELCIFRRSGGKYGENRTGEPAKYRCFGRYGKRKFRRTGSAGIHPGEFMAVRAFSDLDFRDVSFPFLSSFLLDKN